MEALPEGLREFIFISEIDDAHLLITPLFLKKFGQTPPNFPHHFAAFYRADDGALHILSYGHMFAAGDAFLSGGASTDGDVIRLMSSSQQAAIAAAGGVRRWVLSYAMKKLGERCRAFFAYCGDARALSICKDVGFESTDHPFLIAHWHQHLSDTARAQLIAQVHALGPF